jgi:hypothetical protein
MTAEQGPESASPALADGLAQEITVIYSVAETDIITVITTRVQHSLSAGGSTAAFLAGTHTVQSETARILGRAERDSGTAVRHALASAYGHGGGNGPVRDGTVRNVLERLAAIRNAMSRWVTTMWQRIIGLSTQPDSRVLIGRALQREAGHGITAYTPSGRRRGAVSLAEEVTQHAAGGVVIDGFADRLAADGGDLVIVTLSPHPCPVCKPWEHKVLSITGDSADHPSMAHARAAGLFHPRCHHTIVAWYPGFVWPPHSIEHKPGTYDQVQRQRAIERHIREWKRREAAALDDVTRLNAKRKRRGWEAALRQHLATHGLQRSRQRERTDYGHTRSLTHAHGRRDHGQPPPVRPVGPKPTKLPAPGRSALDDLKAVARGGRTAKRERLLGGQTNTVEKVTLPDGRTAVHKTARSGFDDPDHFFADGEELAAKLGNAVDAPVAQVYRDGPDSVWVQWIDGTREGAHKLIDTPEGVRIGLLDALTGYVDRNLMVDRSGRLVAFDHGGSWLAAELGEQGPHLADPNAPMKHFVSGDEWKGNPPMRRAELDRIRRRIEALRPAFAKAGRLDWLAYSLDALDEIRMRARR